MRLMAVALVAALVMAGCENRASQIDGSQEVYGNGQYSIDTDCAMLERRLTDRLNEMERRLNDRIDGKKSQP